MEIRKSNPSEYLAIQKFYKKFGYKWNIKPNDYVMIAKDKGKIIGTVRISEENNNQILRGMFIDGAYKGQGIEVKMLAQLEQHLQSKESYCVPYVHLKGFFKQFGYEVVAVNKAPAFIKKLLLLKKRYERYTEKNGILIIMKKRKLEET